MNPIQRQDESSGPSDMRKALTELTDAVINTIHHVENRCMANDGPVTLTSDEITERELKIMYDAAQRARAALSSREAPAWEAVAQAVAAERARCAEICVDELKKLGAALTAEASPQVQKDSGTTEGRAERQRIVEVFRKHAGSNDNGIPYLTTYEDGFVHIAKDLLAALSPYPQRKP